MTSATLHFTHVRFKNFLSSGNSFIEVSLDSHPSTLIVGRNGHGKSTLIEAIIFGLYGKPFRPIKLGQLVNRINRKACEVQVEFTRGGNHYKVVRGLAPGKFEIYCNGELRPREAKSADYQSGFEKDVLRISHKSFCQAVVLGTASYVPFMKLPTPDRRKFIEDLLDLDIFTKMNIVLKGRISDNKTAVKDAQHVVSMGENTVKLLEQQRQQAEESEAKSQDVLDRRRNALILQRDQLKDQVDSVKQQILELPETDDEKAKQTRDELVKIEKYLTKMQFNIEAAQKEVRFLTDHDNCPTCSQIIDARFRHQKIQDGKTKIEELKKTQSGLVESKEEREEFLAGYDSQQDLLRQLSLRGKQLVTEVKQLDNQIKQIEADKSFVASTFDYKQLSDATATLKQAKAQLNSLMQEAELNAAASKLLADTGIKARIIAKFIPELNELINGYLAKMDMFVGFELDEDFNETIKARYLEETSYDSFSQGEKMRIDLALLFAWRAVGRKRNSTNCNLFMMDEILDGALDSNGTSEALQIIRNLSGHCNSFIVSHKEDQVSDFFDRVIRVEKVDGFTEMNEEVVSGSIMSSEEEI